MYQKMFSLLGSTAQNLFSNLKKKYLRKKNDVKSSKRLGMSSDVVFRAEGNFERYQFLTWLDVYTQIREGRTSVPATYTPQNNCSHFHNILMLFDVLTNFPYTTSETMRN